MNAKLQAGLNRASIQNARSLCPELREIRREFACGIIDKDRCDQVLQNAEAILTVIAGQLEKAAEPEVIVIASPPSRQNVGHEEFRRLYVGEWPPGFKIREVRVDV